MVSDGTIEHAGVDIVHFLCQMAFLTEVPSIYHPHDLQHVHLPEMLPARDVELRELWYRAFCEQASLVVAMTQWGRRDLIESYGLRAERTAVVPWGAVTGAFPDPTAADLVETRGELGVPEGFLLYPAQYLGAHVPRGLPSALPAQGAARYRPAGCRIPATCTRGSPSESGSSASRTSSVSWVSSARRGFAASTRWPRA